MERRFSQAFGATNCNVVAYQSQTRDIHYTYQSCANPAKGESTLYSNVYSDLDINTTVPVSWIEVCTADQSGVCKRVGVVEEQAAECTVTRNDGTGTCITCAICDAGGELGIEYSCDGGNTTSGCENFLPLEPTKQQSPVAVESLSGSVSGFSIGRYLLLLGALQGICWWYSQ